MNGDRKNWSFLNGEMLGTQFNLLEPELFFFNFSTTVYKMWIIQEPNTLELWNKLNFEAEKNGEYIPYLKYSLPLFVE